MGIWHEIIIQILTIGTTYYLMRQLSENKMVCALATLLYVICPYRIYLLRTGTDLGRMIVFTVLPLLIAFAFALLKKERKWLYLFLTAVCIGIITYADAVISCFVIGFMLIYALWAKAWKLILAMVCGTALGCMEGLELIKYLLTGVTDWQDVSLAGIMPGAYTLGRYLSTYFYPAGKPGIGILLMGVLMLLLWLVMTDAEYHLPKLYRFALFTVVMTGFMASVWFPWDIIQRVSVVLLRFVPLIGELNVFVGMMSLGISILSTDVLDKFIKKLK